MSKISDFLSSTYSDEKAQDAIGNILDTESSSGDIDFTYDDTTPKISGRVNKNVNNKGGVSGNQTFDLTQYGCITLSCTGNTSFDLTGTYSNNKMYVTELLITNGGAYTLTWASKFKFPGGIKTLTVAGIDSLTLITVDGGVSCRVLFNGKDIK